MGVGVGVLSVCQGKRAWWALYDSCALCHSLASGVSDGGSVGRFLVLLGLRGAGKVYVLRPACTKQPEQRIL